MVDLALVVLCIFVVVVGMVAGHLLIKLRQPQKHPDALWQEDEHPREIGPHGPSAYAFYCVHPDEEPQLIEAVYWNDPDFDAKCAEARIEAQLRCQTLNNKLKRLKR